MWVADQVGRGATGKRVGLVDCASSIRDKGCRVSQDAQEPPFPSKTANPRPVRVQGLSQGAPFLALLPFSLSPSSGRKGRVVLLLLRAACTVCSPSSECVCLSVCARACLRASPAPPAPCRVLARAFFFFYCIPPPVSPRRRPLLFPSLHRESLTVSPPNRLVAESTDSLPSSPFLPLPASLCSNHSHSLEVPIVRFSSQFSVPVQSFRASHLHSFG